MQDGYSLLHVVFHNITEEAQLYESIVESSDSAVFIVDEDTQELIYSNESARKYASEHGWLYEGLHCYEFFKGRDSQCENCYMKNTTLLENDNSHIEWKDTIVNRYYNVHVKRLEWFGRNIRIHFLRDVNDSKQTFFELQQSQSRLDHAVKGAGFAVLEYDLDKHCIYQEERERKSFETAPVIENVPWSIVEAGIIAPESVDAYMDIYNRLLAGEEEVSGEYWCRKGDDLCYYRLCYSVEKGLEQGNIAYGLAQDITLAKLNSERYEKTMNLMLSSNPSVLQIYHLNITKNEIRTVEQSILKEGVHTVDDFVELACTFIGEKERVSFKKHFSRENLHSVFQQAERYISYKHSMLQDGDIIFGETSVTMVENPINGDLEAILRVRDITQQLLEEKITQQITNETCDFIALIDTTDKCIEYRHKNSNRREQLGIDKYPLESELERGIRVIESDTEREICRQKMQLENIISEIEKNKIYKIQYTRKFHEEEPSRKIHRYSYLDESKRYILLICSDITESYNMQREHIAKIQEALDRAEQATKAKTDFLSNMSHDMRTPMNAILGLTNLAMDSENLDEIKDYLLKVNESGRYLLSLINNTLDMSRIENGKLELKPELIEANNLMDMVIASTKVATEQKGIDFVVDKENVQNFTLYVDTLKISKIFMNLLSNAVKFTPKGGRVEVRICSICRDKDVSHMEIQICDTGIGIDESFLPNIFEPFKQESVEITSNYNGTGLGMAIINAFC